MTINTHELAWAAGFFDGEGSTSASHNRPGGPGHLSVAVGQTNRETLERFQRAVGGLGKIYGPRRPSKASFGKVQRWDWKTTNFQAGQAVIAMLWRFLSEPKREQAQRILEAL